MNCFGQAHLLLSSQEGHTADFPQVHPDRIIGQLGTAQIKERLSREINVLFFGFTLTWLSFQLKGFLYIGQFILIRRAVSIHRIDPLSDEEVIGGIHLLGIRLYFRKGFRNILLSEVFLLPAFGKQFFPV
jgi:hypothetical protein